MGGHGRPESRGIARLHFAFACVLHLRVCGHEGSHEEEEEEDGDDNEEGGMEGKDVCPRHAVKAAVGCTLCRWQKTSDGDAPRRPGVRGLGDSSRVHEARVHISVRVAGIGRFAVLPGLQSVYERQRAAPSFQPCTMAQRASSRLSRLFRHSRPYFTSLAVAHLLVPAYAHRRQRASASPITIKTHTSFPGDRGDQKHILCRSGRATRLART